MEVSQKVLQDKPCVKDLVMQTVWQGRPKSQTVVSVSIVILLYVPAALIFNLTFLNESFDLRTILRVERRYYSGDEEGMAAHLFGR